MTEAKRPRLYIIDAMALAYRSFFAFGRTSLSTSQGIPTGAIYGTAMFMNKLINEERPTYLVAVNDSPEPTFRHEMYKDYKGTRDEMPDDLSKQLSPIFELMQHFHCKIISIPGVEADDVIGTLAVAFAGKNLDVYIVSGDKDFMQLINEHVYLYAPKKNEEALIVDREGVKARFGCTPEQVIDVLALMGDTVDNVPGVAGIGEKGAAKLIETYGSLEGIYKNLDKITAKKQREGLETCKDDAFLSRQLVTLKTDVSLPYGLADFQIETARSVANPELLAFYQQYEFKSLATKVAKSLSANSVAGGAEPTITTPTAVGARDIRFGEAFDALLQAVVTAPMIAVIVETSGPDILADKPTQFVFATSSEDVFLMLGTEEGIYLAREILSNPKIKKVGHGLKGMTEVLANVGIDLVGPLIDLEIADYLLDPNNYDHSIKSLCDRLGLTESAPDSLASQASLMLKISQLLLAKIESLGLSKVLFDIEMPLVPVLASMEREGFYVDAELLDAYSSELAIAARSLEEQLYVEAGGEFNINSPKQLQDLLFEKLKLQEAAGIKRMKRTKTGLSTDESVLSRLAAVHPVPKLILEYRTVAKLKNTYVDTLPQFINPKSGKIHTSFRQAVAATGRLSSDKPNLQNIPMRTDLGKRIRKAFHPQNPDQVLISADYSQVELRLLAHLSQDSGLIDAFRRGVDVHTVTAAKIFSVAESAVTPLLRSRAKAVNFGIIYGMGPQRLAEETGVKLGEAKDFIARYFEVYPDIKAYTDSLIESAKKLGYCTTIMGRRRPIPEIRDSNNAVLSRGENIAVNAPIQGSAADLIKLAMIRVDLELKRHFKRSHLVLQVHDELVLTAPKGDVTPVMDLVRDAMEHAMTTSVPLKVEVHSGFTWLDAHG